jgi:hypothetical protein
MLIDATSITDATITNAITAIGALGTASFGLVDATKAFWGGISRCGIRNIRNAIKPLFGQTPSAAGQANALSYGAILANLSANWMNGTDLVDQKAIAKTLLKLRLDPANAAGYAAATGVDAAQLATIATQINQGAALTTPQADVYGRFDLGLTALLDEGYQRADQRYRNSAKVLAGAFSIVIAVYCGYLLSNHIFSSGGLEPAQLQPQAYLFTRNMWAAVVAGALATPLAPIAKDLTSALAAGVDVVQKLRK